jgi:outer membrane protein assembly factor BamB
LVEFQFFCFPLKGINMRRFGLAMAVLAAGLMGAGHPVALGALDPYTNALAVYELPDTAAADGDLAEWEGVPPAASSPDFKFMDGKPLMPGSGFAPAVRCGRKSGTNDLFFLVVVEDDHVWSNDDGPWVAPDNCELYFDFGREARQASGPDWHKTKTWQNAREMGQFGLRPQTLTSKATMLKGIHAGQWAFEYKTVPVEGGMAYECRLNAASVLADLKMTNLPAEVGFDVGFMDCDYPTALMAGQWRTESPVYRLFGDGMNHAFPIKYGRLALAPQPRVETAPARPRTLPELYGQTPTESQLTNAATALPDAKLADLVFWAALKGCRFSRSAVECLFAADKPHAQEALLAALYSRPDRGGKDLATSAVTLAYAQRDRATPYGLTMANLINRDLRLGFRDALLDLCGRQDLPVVVSATEALLEVGTADDVAGLRQKGASLAADLAAGGKGGQGTNELQRLLDIVTAAADELQVRTMVLPTPKSVLRRTVEPANTDLPRHMPFDNNHVYNAAGLARAWPTNGPLRLWCVELGDCLVTTVESGGRIFTLAKESNVVAAVCMDPRTGGTLWRQPLGGPDNVTPVADGDRVYFTAGGNGLRCLNAATGELIWTSKGFSGAPYSSPLVVGDVLYVSGQPALTAVDKKTGAILWKTEGGKTSSPNSPAYQELDGRGQIILGVASGNQKPEVWGIEAKTGEVLWKRPFNVQWGLCSSPVVSGEYLYLCGGHGPRLSECLVSFVHEGRLRARQVYRKDGLQSNSHNTPAVLDGAVYGFGGKGLQCSRLADGQVYWEQSWDLDRHLIVADGLLIASGADGSLALAEATVQGYHELGRFQTGLDLKGSSQQMTLANGHLYVRGKHRLACYDLLSEPGRAPGGAAGIVPGLPHPGAVMRSHTR